MKIGILADRIWSGSAPKVLGTEVKYLRQLGHDAQMQIIMSGMPSGGQAKDYLEDVPMRFFSNEFPPIFKKLNFKFPFFSFFSSFHIMSPYFCQRLIKDKEWDVIVAHSAFSFFAARALSIKRKIPYFAFVWDPIPYILQKVYSKDSPLRFGFPFLISMGKFLDNYLLKESIAIITCSHFHVPLIRSLTKNKKNIEVVYPGCEPSESIPDHRGGYILSVDRWDIGNKPHKILDVIERFDKDAKLLVVGFWHPESLRTSFIDEVKRRNLSDRVEVRGPANREQLRELFWGARVLLHPIEEVFGFVAHEAASYGCPMIMPKGSGNCEIYKHGIHGFFTDGWNVEDYVKYVDILLEDERLAYRMGHDAWEVAKQYTWRKHAISLEKVIMKYVK